MTENEMNITLDICSIVHTQQVSTVCMITAPQAAVAIPAKDTFSTIQSRTKHYFAHQHIPTHIGKLYLHQIYKNIIASILTQSYMNKKSSRDQ